MAHYQIAVIVPQVLPLLEDFEDAPEAGASYNTQHGTENVVLHQETCGDECASGRCECPPAPGSEMVFAFDDDWMEYPYDKECRYKNIFPLLHEQNYFISRRLPNFSDIV